MGEELLALVRHYGSWAEAADHFAISHLRTAKPVSVAKYLQQAVQYNLRGPSAQSAQEVCAVGVLQTALNLQAATDGCLRPKADADAEELDAVLAEIKDTTIRDRLALMSELGLRNSDLDHLNRNDITVTDGAVRIRVRVAKNRRKRAHATTFTLMKATALGDVPVLRRLAAHPGPGKLVGSSSTAKIDRVLSAGSRPPRGSHHFNISASFPA